MGFADPSRKELHTSLCSVEAHNHQVGLGMGVELGMTGEEDQMIDWIVGRDWSSNLSCRKLNQMVGRMVAEMIDCKGVAIVVDMVSETEIEIEPRKVKIVECFRMA